jgi:hypothetical protein
MTYIRTNRHSWLTSSRFYCSLCYNSLSCINKSNFSISFSFANKLTTCFSFTRITWIITNSTAWCKCLTFYYSFLNFRSSRILNINIHSFVSYFLNIN